MCNSIFFSQQRNFDFQREGRCCPRHFIHSLMKAEPSIVFSFLFFFCFLSGIFSNRESFTCTRIHSEIVSFFGAMVTVDNKTNMLGLLRKKDTTYHGWAFRSLLSSSSETKRASLGLFWMPLNCGNNNLPRNYNRGGVTLVKPLCIYASLGMNGRFSSERGGSGERDIKEGIELKIWPVMPWINSN